MSETKQTPWVVGDGDVRSQDITNYILMFKDDQPWFFTIPGCQDQFVAIFSTDEKFDEFSKIMGIHGASKKYVLDGPDFLSSFDGTSIRVMSDPWFKENGNIRFREIMCTALN